MLKKSLSYFYYLKMCYNRATSYTGIPMDLLQKYLLVSVWLKVYNFSNNFIIAMLFLGLIITYITIGYLDIKYKFAHLEVSINNKLNKDLQYIKQNVNKKR